jgi:hypothetical protein
MQFFVPPNRFASRLPAPLDHGTKSHPSQEILLIVKCAILALTFSTFLVGTICFARHETSRAEEIPSPNQRAADLTAAAQIKPFSPASPEKGAAYLRTVTEADLLSLHMCQDSHKLFVNEPPSATADGLVDAQSAAECVVQLQSALREVPATHPAYSDIRTELAWWNGKLQELDSADYRRLNS